MPKALPNAQPAARTAVARTRRDITKTVSATKNLRAISLSLVQKLRSSPRGIPSTDIANQLAKEAVRQVVGVDTFVSAADLTAVEKNIRRRLYDSLKVLVSIGAIRRSAADKMLHWQGVTHLLPPPPSTPSCKLEPQLQPQPQSQSQSQSHLQSHPQATATVSQSPASPWHHQQLTASLTAARTRLDDKSALLQQLALQKLALERLCKRNRTAIVNIPPTAKIHLPFVVVRTPHATDITLESTPDTSSMAFRFSDNFEIVNDAGILDRLFCVDDPPPPMPRRHPSPAQCANNPNIASIGASFPAHGGHHAHHPNHAPSSRISNAAPCSPDAARVRRLQQALASPPAPGQSPGPRKPPLPPPSRLSAEPADEADALGALSGHARASTPDLFQSPKRVRVQTAGASPFAKYTSGDKPPLSPGTPLMRRRNRRYRRYMAGSSSDASVGSLPGMSPQGRLARSSPPQLLSPRLSPRLSPGQGERLLSLGSSPGWSGLSGGRMEDDLDAAGGAAGGTTSAWPKSGVMEDGNLSDARGVGVASRRLYALPRADGDRDGRDVGDGFDEDVGGAGLGSPRASPMLTPSGWSPGHAAAKGCSSYDGRDIDARQLFINE